MKDFLKCRKCPYKLGEVKCKTNPCPECIASGRKKPPFQLSVILKESNMHSISELK